VSRDYDPELDGPLPASSQEPDLPATKRYPICPECGCNTLVMFSPPREGIVGTEEGYRLWALHSADYVDWDKAHLYCCNGQTNCQINIPVRGGMTTPVKEKRRRFVEDVA
jgi:hypothetical protein